MTAAPLQRPASPDDISALIDLSVRTIRVSYGPFLGEDVIKQYIEGGYVDTFANACIPRASVVEHDGVVAGYAASKDDLLELLMIDHQFHRQGLGRALLAFHEQVMFDAHAEIQLHSFEDNAAANAFYKTHGWRETGRHTEPDWGIRMLTLQKSRPVNVRQ